MNENEQIKRFSHNGFFVQPGFFTIDEVAALKQEIFETADRFPSICTYEKSALSGMDILHRIYCPAHFNAHIDVLAKRDRLATFASGLYAEEVVLLTDKVNLKFPGGRGFTAHKDMEGVFKEYVDNIITAFICLDDCTLENGCLEVYDKNAGVFLPLITKAGDIIFLDGFLAHKSNANYSEKSRVSYILIFNKRRMGNHRDVFTTGTFNTAYKG